MTTNTRTEQAQRAAALDVLMDAGFEPAEMVDIEDLYWIAQHDKWVAFRVEANGMVTLVSFDDNTVVVEYVARNYVIHSEARFDMTDRGLAWLAAALDLGWGR